jgi:hypothetical protein
VSLAQPDKLSLPLQTVATDNVVNFMMRMKKIYRHWGAQSSSGQEPAPGPEAAFSANDCHNYGAELPQGRSNPGELERRFT